MGTLRKRLYLNRCRYITKHSRNVIFISLPVDPVSTAADLNPPNSTSLPTTLSLPTVKMDTSTPSDLDLLIAR